MTTDLSLETKSLELVCALQSELSAALNSLGGKQSAGLLDHYNLYSAGHINRAAEGFTFLRQASRVDSSKLLIRPAIEVMIRILAVRAKPDLLYRIAYTERLEDTRWLRPIATRAGKQYDHAEEQQQWKEFTDKYRAQFPSHQVVEAKLPIADAAAAAGLADYYNAYYRMYCKYTHAALRAVAGGLDELADREDNRTMALCAFTALQAMVSLNAVSPNFDSLRQRIDTFGEGWDLTPTRRAPSL